MLLHVLRLFARARVPAVVIAWSAGAMALTERVLLFHDRAPARPVARRSSSTAASGWLRGCVLLPHARRRLRTDDPSRMAELASRGRHRRAAWSSTTACGSTSARTAPSRRTRA